MVLAFKIMNFEDIYLAKVINLYVIKNMDA